MIERWCMSSFATRPDKAAEIRPAMVLMAVSLVQPGILGDVVEGIQRLIEDKLDYAALKARVGKLMPILIENGLVELYAGRRYVVSTKGKTALEASEIRHQIEARRMYLLKETRRHMVSARSGTRDGSL